MRCNDVLFLFELDLIVIDGLVFASALSRVSTGTGIAT